MNESLLSVTPVAATWLRLPMQFPMIASGIHLAKGEG